MQRHFPKETKEIIGNKNITTNIFRIQANDSVMCEYFYFGFIEYILSLRGKLNRLYYSFPTKNFKDNDKIILKYIKNG